ncbi:MAG: hypothetical protein ACK559_26055, partial [bacterium]
MGRGPPARGQRPRRGAALVGAARWNRPPPGGRIRTKPIADRPHRDCGRPHSGDPRSHRPARSARQPASPG